MFGRRLFALLLVLAMVAGACNDGEESGQRRRSGEAAERSASTDREDPPPTQGRESRGEDTGPIDRTENTERTQNTERTEVAENTDVGESGGGGDPGRCAEVIDTNITSALTLTDGPSECDYRLSGNRMVTGLLTIEPGVVVRADADSGLTIDGGQVLSVGTPDRRITLEGMSHVAGFWDGIDFRNGRASRFESTDIVDAGQVCNITFCADAGLILRAMTVSMVDSSVSNSFVNGAVIGSNVLVEEFSNNRFFGNSLAGIAVNPEHAASLDAASVYSGGGDPNGTPFALVIGGGLDEGVVRTWEPLEAPYLIDSYLDINGGTLVLEPGTEVVFRRDARLVIDGNGTMRAVGSAARPVVIRGMEAQFGYWDGISFRDSPWESNEFAFVDIRHSGATGGLLAAFGAIYVDGDSRVSIANSTFVDNAEFAVNCSDSDFDNPVVALGAGNTFERNTAGDIDPACILA